MFFVNTNKGQFREDIKLDSSPSIHSILITWPSIDIELYCKPGSPRILVSEVRVVAENLAASTVEGSFKFISIRVRIGADL